MTDAGFFRGTSSDQDNRFADKQKKLLKELNYSPILGTKLQTSKLDIDSLKPWIENKIKEILEKDDEILSELIYEHLAEKEPDGKTMLVSITGFVDDQTRANKFMEDLWNKLVDLQNDRNGLENRPGADSHENEPRAKNSDDAVEKKRYGGDHAEDNSKHSGRDDKSSRSSRTPTPPRRSVSKSPTGQKLDEHSRGRPRRRLQDDDSPIEDSQSHASKNRNSNSRSRSRSHSGDDKSSRGHGSKSRTDSRSRSRSKASGSRSRSRSYSRSSSRSQSGSRSRSSSRSPRRRSRSPRARPYRGRKTRSRSRSREYRPRSRSPLARRGNYNNRGVYRGGAPFGYPDRRRGGFSSFRRRPSPSWGRRRFSPRSPVRRRRTPSYSPRRRRSPPPFVRRYSRSRSPPNIVMGRDAAPSPRGHHVPRGHMDPIGARHAHPHDMRRPMLPLARSPVRPPLEHRGYNEGSLLPRRSPGPVMGRPDLPPPSQSFLPGPSASSPSSGKKKHKKDKKHRRHKKSKKHHSDSPERKKKHKKHKEHKKHKKSKKHKS